MSSFVCRPADLQADREWARQLHHRAFRDVVIEQFGSWDEPLQDGFFERSWDRDPFSVIVVESEAAGVISVTDHPDHLFLVNLYISPEYQGQGIGTAIIEELQARARGASLPIRLQVLHKNQARLLYERCGFVGTGRSDTHFFMEWRGDL